MMTINNRNSYGFFVIYDDDDQIVIKKMVTHCSQMIKMTFDISNDEYKVKNGKIKFYYPSDWLIRQARNKSFFNYWIDLTSNFFCEVKYLGNKTSSEIGTNFTSVKGWQNENELKLDMGSFIIEDKWEAFEIKIKENSHENQLRNYCAYCMVRYLFSDHYDQVVKNFCRFVNLKAINGINAKMIEDFELLQMAHYYFAGNYGFNETFSLLKVANRETFVSKLLSKQEFDVLIKNQKDGNLGKLFQTRFNSNLKISDFQKRIEGNDLIRLYGEIK